VFHRDESTLSFADRLDPPRPLPRSLDHTTLRLALRPQSG
jgi:hypothetical protein